jgi:hypothetical protein
MMPIRVAITRVPWWGYPLYAIVSIFLVLFIFVVLCGWVCSTISHVVEQIMTPVKEWQSTFTEFGIVFSVMAIMTKWGVVLARFVRKQK